MEIKGNITRTFFTCVAFGYAVDGVDPDTHMPTMNYVASDEYVCVNKNDMALAKRMVKKANKKVIPDTVEVRVISEDVRAMSLDMFYSLSEVVERGTNGRIK